MTAALKEVALEVKSQKLEKCLQAEKEKRDKKNKIRVRKVNRAIKEKRDRRMQTIMEGISNSIEAFKERNRPPSVTKKQTTKTPPNPEPSPTSEGSLAVNSNSDIQLVETYYSNYEKKTQELVKRREEFYRSRVAGANGKTTKVDENIKKAHQQEESRVNELATRYIRRVQGSEQHRMLRQAGLAAAARERRLRHKERMQQRREKENMSKNNMMDTVRQIEEEAEEKLEKVKKNREVKISEFKEKFIETEERLVEHANKIDEMHETKV